MSCLVKSIGIEQNQTFEELGLGNSNVNFNTWNLDLNYTWQVAPGSFLTALYRNQLFNFSENSEEDYYFIQYKLII